MKPLLSTPLSLRSPRVLPCGLPVALLLCFHAAAMPVVPAAATPAPTVTTTASLLAAPQIEPQVLRPGGAVTLTLSNFPLSTSRLRVGLFEAGRPARVADALRDFSLRDGRLQTTLTVEADPGRYELRLLSNDRARTPISQGAPLLVPGVDREPGWWLLNGSPFVQTADAANAADASVAAPLSAPVVAANAPLFIPGLKRGGRKKELSRNVFVPSAAPLRWKTFELPPLEEMMAPGYNFAALRADLSRRIGEAQARGERNFVGFALPSPRLQRANPAAINALRQIMQSLVPNAALILDVDASTFGGDLAGFNIPASLALFDAVVLRYDPAPLRQATWLLKTARRVAEEQPEFDLPIFVRPQTSSRRDDDHAAFEQSWLDLWMGGATGLIGVQAGIENAPRTTWGRLIERNAPLFIGSVTLEDIGLLPAEVVLTGGRNEYLYSILRDARRIPLLARLTRGKKNAPPESLVVALEKGVSNAMIERLRLAANDGARIYIEGAPLRDENGRPAPWRMGALVGGDAKPLDGNNARSTAMILQDGWMFGTGRGTRVAVEQSVVVTLRPATAATQAKPEKGKDVLTGPRIAARLEDGTPAMIINPVGKGEVIWVPHIVLPDHSQPRAAPRAARDATPDAARDAAPAPGTTPRVAAANAAPLPAPATRAPDAASLNVDRSTPLQRFYAAVAAYVQPGLVSLRGTDKSLGGAETVRVALRRSAKGTPLLALFNSSNRPAAVAAGVDGVAGIALDLATERALPLSVRGFQSEAMVTIPARGWKLIAFAESRKSLDDERNAPRLKARLR